MESIDTGSIVRVEKYVLRGEHTKLWSFCWIERSTHLSNPRKSAMTRLQAEIDLRNGNKNSGP
jgi:hypothetical protein